MSKLSYLETDHHVEKLEFALAISQTIGDQVKSNKIKEQLNNIGEKSHEPGT